MTGKAPPMRRRAAVNFEPRRHGRAVDMIVLHYTGMDSAAAACDLLCGADGKVSCHYLVDEDGTITAMVGEEFRAWHAGASFWKGETDTNSRSIGIELHNPGHGPFYRDFPRPQMEAVAGLCLDIMSRHAIPPRHVLAHSDVAPGRKIDPGERFHWRFLHAQGIGHWTPPAEPDAAPLSTAGLLEFQRLLSAYGYDIAITGLVDERTRKATDAFTRHFRPALVTGVPDISALRTARRLVG
ncbi:MAG: N-acetylmuramoyl-L-alanine amidase [Aestuariivirga sp.]|uniref:N-acetylmuramoyl-L-alanine amidase n=1 Tax=Aestuariivirga sp. TaxID=2650926 RepID=UPI0038D1A294